MAWFEPYEAARARGAQMRTMSAHRCECRARTEDRERTVDGPEDFATDRERDARMGL